MNSNKFEYLINDIEPEGKGKIKLFADEEETIRNILVTADIEGLAIMDDVSYPLFNFIVQKDDEGKYTMGTASVETTRLIDNFPVSGINDHLDAKISIQVFTNKNSELFYSFIGEQLMNLSTAINPKEIAMSLVSEFGQIIKNQSKGLDYQLAATIRLFEGTDSERQLHSVNIYVLSPTSKKVIGFTTGKLEKYLAQSSNQKIDKQILDSYLSFAKYPYIIAVNYRSKYSSQYIALENIDISAVNIKRADVTSDHTSKIISDLIFKYESAYIENLEYLANMKSDLDLYNMACEKNLTDDFSKSYNDISYNYRKIIKAWESIQKQYNSDSGFDSLFLQRHKDIYDYAELSLESDKVLKNIKKSVNILTAMEDIDFPELDSATYEKYLGILYATDILEQTFTWNFSEEIKSAIEEIEKEFYKNNLAYDIDKLAEQAVNEELNKKIQEVIRSYAISNCLYCREKLEEFVEMSDADYKSYLIEKELLILDSLVSIAKELISKVSLSENDFSYYFNKENNYDSESFKNMTFTEFENLKTGIKELKELIYKDIDIKDHSQIIEREEEIIKLTDELEFSYNLLIKVTDTKYNSDI